MPHPQHIAPAIFAGSISGLVTLTYSVSYAALIFSGPLSSYFSLGISTALISATLIAFIVALGSSFPFSIAGPDSNASAILALMAATIASNLDLTANDQLISTALTCIIFSTAFVGLSLFLIGKLKLGHFVRFIPYPVLGGFLAGTGWLISKGAFTVMTGETLSLQHLVIFTDKHHFIHWLPGVCFAMILFFVLRRFKHFLIFPALLLSGIFITHLTFWMCSMSLDQASLQGWLFAPFPSRPQFETWSAIHLSKIQWGLIVDQLGNILAMTGVVIITILLNATGIELSTHRDANLNKELSTAGIANLLSASLGGMLGYLSISRSILNYKAGATHRTSGIAAAGCCLLVFFFGSSILTFLPKLVLGGLLFYLGFHLLYEWIIEAREKLSKLDYALVTTILFVIAFWGFLEGVAVGLIISIILFVVNYSRINIVQHILTGEQHRSSFVRSVPQLNILKKHGQKIYIMNLQGYLFFGTANNLIEEVKTKVKQENSHIQYIILDFRLVTGLDSSVTLSFEKIHQIAESYHASVFLTDLKPDIAQHFSHKDTQNKFKIFPTLDYCVQWCEDQIIHDQESKNDLANQPLQGQLVDMFLPEAQAQKFMTYLETVNFKKGETVFEQGDQADSMFFVESGLVTATLHIPGKNPIRLLTMGAGTVFGEMGLYTRAPRTAAIVIDENSILYELKVEELNRMQKEDPEMATALHYFIIRLLAERVSLSNKKIQVLV